MPRSIRPPVVPARQRFGRRSVSSIQLGVFESLPGIALAAADVVHGVGYDQPASLVSFVGKPYGAAFQCRFKRNLQDLGFMDLG